MALAGPVASGWRSASGCEPILRGSWSSQIVRSLRNHQQSIDELIKSMFCCIADVDAMPFMIDVYSFISAGCDDVQSFGSCTAFVSNCGTAEKKTRREDDASSEDR